MIVIASSLILVLLLLLLCSSDHLPAHKYQEAVRSICNEVEALVKKCGKPKMFDAVKLPPPELYGHVEVCSFCCSHIE